MTYGSSGGASLSGGLGINTYQPLPGPTVSGDWVFDNVTGQASKDDVAQIVWSSFQRFNLTGLHGPSVRFLGSRAHEWVVAGGTCRVVLRGRAGRRPPHGRPRRVQQPPGRRRAAARRARERPAQGLGRRRRAEAAAPGTTAADGGLGTNTCDVEIPVAC